MQTLERAQQQPRSREHDQRERDLKRDHRSAKPMLRLSCRSAPSALAQRDLQLDAADAERGNGATDRGDDDGDHDREHDRRNIQAQLGETWNLRGSGGDQRAHGEPGHCESSRRGDGREYRRLTQKVRQHTRASSAERLADGELSLAAVGPHEDQIRDVGARNEQNEGRGRRDDP